MEFGREGRPRHVCNPSGTGTRARRQDGGSGRNPERSALRRILALGFEDTFRLFDQPEQSFSWWDYRMNSFKRNRGLRIDLVLASSALARRCTAGRVDAGPRRLDRPSDHAPAVAVAGGFGAAQAPKHNVTTTNDII